MAAPKRVTPGTRRRWSTLFAEERPDVNPGFESGEEGEEQNGIAPTAIRARQLFVNNSSANVNATAMSRLSVALLLFKTLLI